MHKHTRRVEWTPLVGMIIECDAKSGGKLPGHRAKIVEVTESAIRVVHEASGIKTFISTNTARKQWHPAPEGTATSQSQSVTDMTERRIREIVREELRSLLTPQPRPTQP